MEFGGSAWPQRTRRLHQRAASAEVDDHDLLARSHKGLGPIPTAGGTAASGQPTVGLPFRDRVHPRGRVLRDV